jgi:hypothetical protein
MTALLAIAYAVVVVVLALLPERVPTVPEDIDLSRGTAPG